MSLRLIHKYLKNKDQAEKKEEKESDSLLSPQEKYTQALTSEVGEGRYCKESKDFLAWAVSALSLCKNEEEMKKIITGCLTIAYVVNDHEYATTLSKYRPGEIASAIKDKEMRAIFEFYTSDEPIRPIVALEPSATSIKTAFFNVAKYVSKDKRGEDDASHTLYLKSF